MAAPQLRRLFLLQISNTVAECLGWSFVYLYAYNYFEATSTELVFIFLLSMSVPLPLLVLIRGFHGRASMAPGLAFKALALMIFISPLPFWRFFLAAAVYGLAIPFFWVQYNSLYMLAAHSRRMASASTWLFALFAFGAAFLPFLGGHMIASLGYASVFLASALILSIGIAYLSQIPGGAVASFSTKELEQDLAITRAFVLPEGFWQGVFMIGVPLGTLFFFDRPEGYGLFLAFLGTMGGVASILAGRWSDSRMEPFRPLLYSSLAAAVLSMLCFVGTRRVELWGLTVGLTYFCIYTMYSFTFMLTRRLCIGTASGMTAREIWLNIGRVAGASAVLLSALFLSSIGPALVLGGASLLWISRFALRS